MLTWTSLALIDGYQRYLSPRKGFACAYRVKHGSTVGCSGYAKHAIAQNGLLRAWPLIRERFADCKTAALDLAEQQSDGTEHSKKKRNRNILDSCWTDSCCFAAIGCGGTSGAGASSGAGGGSCDATPDCAPDCTPDCGSCGCGS